MLYAYGVQTPITTVGELRLPAGVSKSGTLNVFPAALGPNPGGGNMPLGSGSALASRGTTDDRQTVAQRVAAVNALPTNDQLVVVFTPDSGASATSAESIQTTLTVSGSYVTGSIEQRIGKLRLRVSPASAPFRSAFVVSGALAADVSADLMWKPPLGASNVRARVAATTVNGAARAAAVMITATRR